MNLKLKELHIISVYLVAMFFIPTIIYLSFLNILYLVIVKGKEWYIKSFILITLLKFINPSFGAIDSNISYIVIIVILIKLIINLFEKKILRLNILEKRFYFLILLFFITSSINSMYIDLSLIKLTIYGIIIFIIFQSIALTKDYNYFIFLLNIAKIFIISSGILLFMEDGYFINGLFMGIVNQSQTIGLFLVPFIILLYFFELKDNFSFFTLILLILSILELYMSGSRTSLIALIAAFLIYLFYNTLIRNKYSIKKIIIFSISFLIIIITYVWNQNTINNSIYNFLVKNSKVAQTEELLGKRGQLLIHSYKNFKDNLWTGIGFNVQTFYADPEDHELSKLKYIPGTNLIYNKPLEKGNLYISVFEEGGLISGLFFISILITTILKSLKEKITVAFVSLVAIYISFNGESALFSSGGIGPFQIILIILLYNLTYQKHFLKKGNI